jgi:hypothetical protein
VRDIDYEKFVFWDAILFPALVVVVAAAFSVCCYIDMRRSRSRGTARFLYRVAIVAFISAGLSQGVILANDLWVVATDMQGEVSSQWHFAMHSVFIAVLAVSMAIAFSSLLAAIVLRVRGHTSPLLDSSSE